MTDRNYNVTINHEIGHRTGQAIKKEVNEFICCLVGGIVLSVVVVGGISLFGRGSVCSTDGCREAPSAFERMINK